MEIVISLVILGILVSSITAGTSLIKSAKIKSALTELSDHEVSFHTFQLNYGYKPGDFPHGISWGPTACGAGSGVDGQNGDGDGKIRNIVLIAQGSIRDQTIESFAAWCHLYSANLLNTPISVMTDDTFTPIRGVNVPTSKASDAAILHVEYDSGVERNALFITEPTQGMLNKNAALTPQQAYTLISKAGGVANNAKIKGYAGSDIVDPTLCNTGNSFNLTYSSKSCVIQYYID